MPDEGHEPDEQDRVISWWQWLRGSPRSDNIMHPLVPSEAVEEGGHSTSSPTERGPVNERGPLLPADTARSSSSANGVPAGYPSGQADALSSALVHPPDAGTAHAPMVADSQPQIPWWWSPKTRTTLMVNLTGIMERSDEQILPALYRYVGASFNASPSQLGYLTLSRALVQALASPVGGIAGHYYNRVWVITAGCLLWGFMTACFAATHSVVGGTPFWAINGIGLSLVIPNSQSLIADYYEEFDRGKAFGTLYLTGAIGAMLGTLYSTNMGHLHPMGIEGWRFAFLTVAAVSALIGVGTFYLAHDPRFEDDSKVKNKGNRHEAGSLSETLRDAADFMTLPTFLIIILQGVVGSTPWNAMVFFTLYLQLLGMSDFAASLLYALFLGGTAFGGLLGGWVGDMSARFYPNHGRIFVTQFSVFAGVPFTFLLMKGLPKNGDTGTVVLYAAVLIVMGSLISWAAPAFNSPAFAEIVPPNMRNLIYAFDRTFEMAIAALAAPIVGVMAERWFGFKGAASKSEHPETDKANAEALGNALIWCCIVPWALCFIFYTGLHFTYPRDKKRAHQLSTAHPIPADDPENPAIYD